MTDLNLKLSDGTDAVVGGEVRMIKTPSYVARILGATTSGQVLIRLYSDTERTRLEPAYCGQLALTPDKLVSA